VAAFAAGKNLLEPIVMLAFYFSTSDTTDGFQRNI
jgi:hypothetical protein